jgi:ABC-type amino acid transport substrate-binding protein
MKRPLILLSCLLLASSAFAASVAEVKKKGVLILGTDPTFQPFEFKGADGSVQGFDIDIARAVARDLGVKLQIQAVGFGALMPQSVTSGRVDVAMSGITITPERAKVVGFSAPYYRSAQVFIAKAGNPKGAVLKVYDDFAAGLADVQSGRIDALLGDAPTVSSLNARLPGQFEQAGKELVAENYGMVVARGSDLAAAANRTLARLRASGAYQKLLEKWIVQK